MNSEKDKSPKHWFDILMLQNQSTEQKLADLRERMRSDLASVHYNELKSTAYKMLSTIYVMG